MISEYRDVELGDWTMWVYGAHRPLLHAAAVQVDARLAVDEATRYLLNESRCDELNRQFVSELRTWAESGRYDRWESTSLQWNYEHPADRLPGLAIRARQGSLLDWAPSTKILQELAREGAAFEARICTTGDETTWRTHVAASGRIASTVEVKPSSITLAEGPILVAGGYSPSDDYADHLSVQMARELLRKQAYSKEPVVPAWVWLDGVARSKFWTGNFAESTGGLLARVSRLRGADLLPVEEIFDIVQRLAHAVAIRLPSATDLCAYAAAHLARHRAPGELQQFVAALWTESFPVESEVNMVFW